MWTQITRDIEGLAEAIDILQRGAGMKAYGEMTLDAMVAYIARKQVDAFLWHADGWRMALVLQRVPGDMLKSAHWAPEGTFDPETAVRIGWTKIREYADQHGCKVIYTVNEAAYEVEAYNQCLAIVPKICWEFENDREHVDGERRSWEFKRDDERKNPQKDAEWKGPRAEPAGDTKPVDDVPIDTKPSEGRIR